MKSDNGLLIGIFTLLGVIISSLVHLVSQYLSRRSQAKLEWQKYCQSNLFKAYEGLYRFVSFARIGWPPSEIRKDFLELMNSSHFKEVSGNMYLFNAEIKNILKQFLAVYYSITDMDSSENQVDVLDKFYREDFNKLLNRIEEIVETWFKQWAI